jgi:hypothetical protein
MIGDVHRLAVNKGFSSFFWNLTENSSAIRQRSMSSRIGFLITNGKPATSFESAS